MNKAKNTVTVTVTENGNQIAEFTSDTIFIVDKNGIFTSISANLDGILKFAIKTQVHFINSFILPLKSLVKLGVTIDMILEEINNLALAEIFDKETE